MSLAIRAEERIALVEISRHFRVTVFMMLLAIFHVFLKRYTGADRFMVGAMVANRPSTGLESLIGVFATSLAFRIDLPGTPTMREIVTQTREVCLEAYGNQYMPLWQLSQLTGQDLDSRRLRPRISFTLQTAPLKSPEIPGLDVGEFACSGATIFEGEAAAVAAFDQAWEVWESENGYRIAVIYRPCFTRDVVEGMLSSFVDVFQSTLQSLVNAPARAGSSAI